MRYLAAFLEELGRAAIWLILGFLLALAYAYAIAVGFENRDNEEHHLSGFTPEYNTAHIDD